MYSYRDGDQYAALRDCHSAINLDPDHLKAHFRMAKCLFELSWSQEALECLMFFKSKFPDYATSHACEALERDIRAAIFSRSDQGGSLLRMLQDSMQPNHNEMEM